ncbi:polysaccharide deacetylase family protein [Dactylosporangium siamense]|uniref:NodB homology domain-containing protein n=1 Tax=Dactylosporangium siamense TaxID=685454 RepID=A0A919PNH3_9ACTN|nr:polysaccharide deacetylase family protein [Dactylosporangium siamense]GIG48000.1 hypothetical protein Dsi01nite_060410 [Dactylosporangium siamense]
MMRTLAAAGGVCALAATGLIGPAQPAAAAAPVTRAAAATGYVALTFDDGPAGDNSRRLLQILAQKGVRATFFLRGDNTTTDPALARQESDAGHDIGNHSFTHPALSGLTDEQVRSELQRTTDALVAAGVPRPRLWRPPFGEVDDRLRAIGDSLGMSQVVFDNVPGDWEEQNQDPAYICDFVVSHARDQSIVLQHDFSAATVDAVGCIIDGLRAKGLEPGRLIPAATQSPLSASWVTVQPWTSTPPAAATLHPVADRDNYAGTGGADAWINTSIWQTAYFKFDLTGVAGDIGSARLRLYRANTEAGPVTVSAHRVDDDGWSESTAPGSLPAAGAVVAQTAAAASAGWVELDVTDLVRAERAGDATVTIAVTSSSGTWTSFHSRDAGDSRPELHIG